MTSVDRLHAVVREHRPNSLHPDTCGGCGFVYTEARIECPSAQAAFDRLNAGGGRLASSDALAGSGPRAAPEAQALPVDDRLPCQRNPQQWDLDVGTLRGWGDALEGCLACPMLTHCRTELGRMYPRLGERGHGPMGLIWAGVAYGNDGQPLTYGQLDDLRHHRGMPQAAA